MRLRFAGRSACLRRWTTLTLCTVLVVPDPTPWTVTRAWGIHLFTSLGVLCSFFAVVTALSDRPEAALVWLMIAQVVDGIDGPLARGYEVLRNVPVLSGHTLDLVVDFTTCVFAPVLFAWQFELLPEPWDMPLLGLVLVTSVLWFSREDIETRDLWFRGFPTAWNVVFTMFWVFTIPAEAAIPITVALCILTLTPWFKVPHILGAPQFRVPTVTLSVIGMVMLTLLVVAPDTEFRPVAVSLIVTWVVYYFAIGFWRSLQGDEILDAPADSRNTSAPLPH